MGYSGLIYAAIVAAWAAFLVPRWVRRNEEVERAREADTVRGVRVLQRRAGPPQAPHGVVVPAPSEPVRVDRPTEIAASPDVFAVAARRRRRMLLVLLLAVIASFAAAYIGRAPGWAPLVPAVLTVFYLFVARRAVVAQARRRRDVQRRQAVRARAASRAAAVVAEHEAVADESAGRRLVIPEEAVAEPEDADGWSPVPVPLPTYLTKPKATARVARKIDLSTAGAWTSGRLDPAGSIELPRRDPVERSAEAAGSAVEEAAMEEQQERRRAVGD